jgi:hypothetical protein
MGRFSTLRQFLGQFIKQKPNKKDEEFKAKQREKQKEHMKHVEEKEYGKHDKYDKDDSIY